MNTKVSVAIAIHGQNNPELLCQQNSGTNYIRPEKKRNINAVPTHRSTVAKKEPLAVDSASATATGFPKYTGGG